MKHSLSLLILIFLVNIALAQYVYTIKADSVKLTNCDSSELIIENHTQNVRGFLYNTGNGRTVFKRGVAKINDSLFLIGADTLNLKTNSWIQGGNRFGVIGVLGTLDNNHLDWYTNGIQRARLTNTGKLLLGTTTDNGNLLQVNGGASIGNATITSAGNLLGTNAILSGHFIPRWHNYHTTSPFISRLDDVLYNYNSRLVTTTSRASDGTQTTDIVFPPDEVGSLGIAYSGGSMYFSFWSSEVPGIISVMAKNSSNVWSGPYTADSSKNLNPGGAGLYEVPIGLSNFLTELKITISPRQGGPFLLMDMAYVLSTVNDGLTNPYPYVSKYGDEHIYNYFYLKSKGRDIVRLSPNLDSANYFWNSILIGDSISNGSAKLQVKGDINTTGAVRFAGLTSDTTKTRVIVSDASGNLYYRDASTLATNGILNSSLAVNGTISAQRLRLSQKGWPDYVFDSSYRLPSLKELEQYIQDNKHLPGIPSAAEVEKKGIDVGDHQAVLLKKIEELTLYNIEQEKKLDRQEKKVETQDKKLEEQAKELNSLRDEIAELKKIILDKTVN